MSEQRLTQSLEKTKQQRACRASYQDSVPSFQGGRHPILQLQRTIGNRAVNRLLQARMLQAKLTVSQPGDVYEQEADRVADQVMRMPEPAVQRTCVPCAVGGPPCQKCEEEKTPTVQRNADLPAARAQQGVPDDFVRDLGPGQPLDLSTRAFFEPRFGYDFGQVRVHTGSDAQRMNRAVGALAFTHGSDIYFGAGHSPTNLRLTAHELTHVVQQTGDARAIDRPNIHRLSLAGKDAAGAQLHIMPKGLYGQGCDSAPRGEEEEKESNVMRKAMFGELHRTNGGGNKGWLQRFSLKGFPPAEEAAMNAAIPVAADTVGKCSKLNRVDRLFVSTAIKNKRYDFVEDLGACGWTFPASWYIEIGKSAFNKNVCCDLPSTIAHEASHTEWFTEGGARKLECDCFGCSC